MQGALRRGRRGQGGVNAPGSALGAPVVSELELHISICLPFKFSRCHLFVYMFFFKKAKMKTKIKKKKVKGDSNCKTKENTVAQLEEEFTQ